MDPLVIKERWKETRVHSCGNAEGHSLTKGTGTEAQITFRKILVWIKNQPHTHAHTHTRIYTHARVHGIYTNK